MEILWFPSWYPNKTDPFEGDFVQRHARATAQFISVHVIFFKRVSTGMHADKIVTEEHRHGNLRETIIYYQAPRTGLALIDKFRAYRHYSRLYRKWLLRKFQAEHQRPRLVHIHVCYRAGLIGLWLRRKWKIPFVLTEHWTVFADKAKPAYETLPFVQRRIISRVMKRALIIAPVSVYLEQMLRERWPGLHTKVIPNVVDLKLFYPGPGHTDRTLKLIHISSLYHQKNPEALLKAANLLIQRGVPFHLDIFGARSSFAEQFKLPPLNEYVRLHDEVDQAELGEALRRSDLLLVPSHYETFSCVITEAHACGIPVAATDLPVIRELVHEGLNGILVKGISGEELAGAIQEFRDHRQHYLSEQIAGTAQRFSFAQVGKQYSDLYGSLI